MTLQTALKEVWTALDTQKEFNENQLVEQCAGSLGVEEWWVKVAAALAPVASMLGHQCVFGAA